MESNEIVTDYFNQITNISNQMKSFGEVVSDQTKISKAMCTLSSRFDYISVAKMDSKDLSTHEC